MIKTWQQRCEEHPDHNGIVSDEMIRARMQEEIDELRAAIEQAQEPRQWQALTDEEITEAIRISGLYMKPSQYTPQTIWLAMLMGYARAIETKLKEKNT